MTSSDDLLEVDRARQKLAHFHEAQCSLCAGSPYMRDLDIRTYAAAIEATVRREEQQHVRAEYRSVVEAARGLNWSHQSATWCFTCASERPCDHDDLRAALDHLEEGGA